MKKVALDVQIESVDSELSYQTNGELSDERLKFVDPEGDLNYVLFKKNSVEYYKKGEIDMKYIFDLDAVTKGYYTVMGNTFEFDIVTHTINLQEDNLHIKYDLYQQADIINKTTINIQYFYKEESQ
jgi:uncharacterized beta-barrel protein YwiB (DUF1934 family)